MAYSLYFSANKTPTKYSAIKKATLQNSAIKKRKKCEKALLPQIWKKKFRKTNISEFLCLSLKIFPYFLLMFLQKYWTRIKLNFLWKTYFSAADKFDVSNTELNQFYPQSPDDCEAGAEERWITFGAAQSLLHKVHPHQSCDQHQLLLCLYSLLT